MKLKSCERVIFQYLVQTSENECIPGTFAPTIFLNFIKCRSSTAEAFPFRKMRQTSNINCILHCYSEYLLSLQILRYIVKEYSVLSFYIELAMK